MIIRVPESAGTIYERIEYPAGELQIRLRPEILPTLFCIAGVSVICRQAHKHLLELALLMDALHGAAPHIPTLVLPYLPYARADSRFVEGDCHGLLTFGKVLTWTMGDSRIKTLDVHSFRAQKYVPRLEDVSARPFIAKAIADICDKGGHPIVLLPDEGAKRYGLDGALQCHKRRDASTGKLSGFEVPSAKEIGNHDILIVDDICDGGGTFIGLAKELNRRRGVYLYVTHGIFSKGLQELLHCFEAIYTTDSLLTETKETNCYKGGRLQVFECEPELLRGLK